MPLRTCLALAGVTVVLAAGCGGAGRVSKETSARGCKQLIAATNVIEPAVTEITEIPNSNADALRRVADAGAATRAALRRVHATSAQGRTAGVRARLLSALNMLAKELVVARTDLRTGRTQQARSQGYVDAGAGIDKVNAAQSAVLAACPQSG